MLGVVLKEKHLRYIANLAVNSHPQELGDAATKAISTCSAHSKISHTNMYTPPTSQGRFEISPSDTLGGRSVGVPQVHEIEKEGLLLTDTTWRGAHQYLLATRMITQDITNVANFINISLKGAFSLEMWCGATFDVAMCFLHKCPWESLKTLREDVPDVPFQMLLRGANAMVYTKYSNNLVQKF